MHVFQFQGLTGLLLLLGLVLVVVFTVTVLPTLVMTALWNAVVFDLFSGPEIGLWQGAILWAVVALALYAWIQPEFALKFADDDGDFTPPKGWEEEDKPTKKLDNDKQWSEHWHNWRKQFGNRK